MLFLTGSMSGENLQPDGNLGSRSSKF